MRLTQTIDETGSAFTVTAAGNSAAANPMIGRRSCTIEYLERWLDGINDLAEYVADCGAKDRKDDDDDDGDQNKD
jgi:hypothetical protein